MPLSQAQQNLSMLQSRLLTNYHNGVRDNQSRLKGSTAFYQGVDNAGRHRAVSLDGRVIYAPRGRMITGGNIRFGRVCSTQQVAGSPYGFIDGMQRGG